MRRALRRVVAPLGRRHQLGIGRIVRLESRRSDFWLMGMVGPTYLYPCRTFRSCSVVRQKVHKV